MGQRSRQCLFPSLARSPMNRTPLDERFRSRFFIEPNSGCWLWEGSVSTTGYGVIGRGGRGGTNIFAHRLSWELHRGPIPEGVGPHGTCVLHKCDTPMCVNPAHLFLGSQADNMADLVAKGRQAKNRRLPKGERHPNAKLTENDVSEIKSCRDSGVTMSKRFGVSPAHISRIRLGQSWAA